VIDVVGTLRQEELSVRESPQDSPLVPTLAKIYCNLETQDGQGGQARKALKE
jgi:hypothetical protein